MKKNKSAVQHKALIKSEQARIVTRFLERMETLCDACAGPGYFSKIHPDQIVRMFETRYPALKAKAEPGMVIPKTKVVQYHKLLNSLVEKVPIDFDSGKSVPLSWYLSDGLTMIHHIYGMSDSYIYAAELKEAFSDYYYNTESDQVITHILGVCVHDADVLLSDYNHGLFFGDFSNAAICNAGSTTNDVLIRIFSPQCIQLVINERKRKLTRVGWPEWVNDEKQDWVWPRVKPSAVGIKTGALEMPVDVYIQQHALDRLKLRIDITPGIMHYMVFNAFMDEKIKYVICDNRNLVECFLVGQKVGYLMVTLHGDKLVIRTFLFLTNDGTPEGKKLKQLYKIGKLDKEYLQIDKLPTFISYHMEKIEHLKRAFTEAGCGSLFKLGHLEQFSKNEIKDRDPQSIERYLVDLDHLKQNE